MSQQAVTSRIGNSRNWTLALGIGAALLAAILLVVYLNRYRSSVNAENAATPVLVAKNLIPKGTSGTIIAKQELFQVASLPKNDLKVGAISDPAFLNGRVAATDIFPGQQITTADLSVDDDGDRPDEPHGDASAPSRSRSTAPAASSATRRRATTSTSTSSLVGGGGNLLTLLAPDVEILRAPAQGQSSTYVLKANCRARPEARVRVRQRHALVPAAAGGRRQEDAAADDHDADAARARRTATEPSGRSSGERSHPRARRRRRARPPRRPASAAGRPELRARRGDRRRRRDRPDAADEDRRRPPRGLPGPRGRPVAPDHRQRPPVVAGASDHRPLGRVAERVPAPRLRGGRSGHGALPADEGRAAVRDEQGDRACTALGLRRSGAARDARLICVLGPKGGTGKTLTSCNLAVALALAGKKVLVIDLDLQFGDVALCIGHPAREDDVRPRDLGRLARRGQAPRLRDDPRHRGRRPPRAGAAGSGERDHDRAAPRRPRRRTAAVRLRDRRHAARASPPR